MHDYRRGVTRRFFHDIVDDIGECHPERSHAGYRSCVPGSVRSSRVTNSGHSWRLEPAHDATLELERCRFECGDVE